MTSSKNIAGKTAASVERYISECGEYTNDYERSKLAADWLGKESRAALVVEDFRRRAMNPAGSRVLDIGFGNGEYVFAFAREGAIASGVEINPVLRDIAVEDAREKGIIADLRLYDGRCFPFPDSSHDAAFSVSVLEHCSDPKAVIAEAARCIRPGGYFYLAFPNRFAPKETHSGFWFVSYLPRALARRALQVFGRNTVDELNLHFLSYFKLKSLIRGTGFTIRFETESGSRILRLMKKTLAICGMHHSILLPHIMVILHKDEQAL